MATLRQDEPVGLGLKRLACEQVEAGVRALTRQADQAASASEAIAEASAVLALIEPALPSASARRDRALIDRLTTGLNAIHRPARLLDRLNAYYKKAPPDSDLAAAVKTLRKRWSGSSRQGSALNSRGGSFDPAIYRLVADMAELRGRLGEWAIDGLEDDAPPPGLRRTYARARRLADPPRAPEQDAKLNDALELISAQLGLLSKCCPPMVKAQRKLIKRAVVSLDELQHDDMLDQQLRKQLGRSKGSALPDHAARTTDRHNTLAPLLQSALAETPTAFINRMRMYWSAWRAGKA